MSENIYELALNESLTVVNEKENSKSSFEIMRVPGGWIYNDNVFVPYSSEFLPRKGARRFGNFDFYKEEAFAILKEMGYSFKEDKESIKIEEILKEVQELVKEKLKQLVKEKEGGDRV